MFALKMEASINNSTVTFKIKDCIKITHENYVYITREDIQNYFEI